MAVEIPFAPGVPRQRFSTVLDGIEYIFDAYWNGRAHAWFFDLYDAEEDLIRAGIKIVLGALLGRRTADARFPAGAFIADDLSREGRDATLNDLGTRDDGARVVVMYFSPADLGTGAAIA